MSLFHLVRHGATDAIGHFLAGRSPQVFLNAEGRAQAGRLAGYFAALPVTRLIASPLERAQETVRPIADRLGLKVETSDSLNELDFGRWTGRRMRELEEEAEWKAWNAFRSGLCIPGGELMIQVQARAVSELERQQRSDASGELVVVTHGDIIRALLSHYLGFPPDLFLRVRIDPGSVTSLRLETHGPEILQVNVRP